MARYYSNHSQRYWTCLALLEGRSISHRDEFMEVDGWRLAAVIHILRKSYDWPIEGEGKGAANIKEYRLSRICDKSKLKFPRSCKELEVLIAEGKL